MFNFIFKSKNKELIAELGNQLHQAQSYARQWERAYKALEKNIARRIAGGQYFKDSAEWGMSGVNFEEKFQILASKYDELLDEYNKLAEKHLALMKDAEDE